MRSFGPPFLDIYDQNLGPKYLFRIYGSHYCENNNSGDVYIHHHHKNHYHHHHDHLLWNGWFWRCGRSLLCPCTALWTSSLSFGPLTKKWSFGPLTKSQVLNLWRRKKFMIKTNSQIRDQGQIVSEICIPDLRVGLKTTGAAHITHQHITPIYTTNI